MKYRKKPVVIEAVRLEHDENSILECVDFLGCGTETSVFGRKSTIQQVISNGGIKIETLEGIMTASFGDYIIKGINGEFYPCKPDIFEKHTKKHNNYGKEQETTRL